MKGDDMDQMEYDPDEGHEWTEENAPEGWHLEDQPCETCHGSGKQTRLVPKGWGK